MRESTRASRWSSRALALLGASLLAWAATAACAYRFGAGDQAQYLARYVQVADPDALGADPYLAAFRAIGSLAWDPIALLVPERSLPAVALALTLLAAALSALALASIARAMLPDRLTRTRAGVLVALAPAAALVVPKELNWFGLVSLSDTELTASLLVMPIMLWSLAWYVRGRAWWSLALLAAAVPVHGQAAAWALAAWTLASAWERRTDARRLFPVALIALVGVIAFLVARARAAVHPASLDAYRDVGLRLYAPLIDPTHAPLSSWGSVLALLALGVIAFIGLRRLAPATDRAHAASDRLALFAAASCLAPAAATLALAAGIEDPLLWRLMPGRGLMLAQIAAVAAAAIFTAARLTEDRRTAWMPAAVLLTLIVWPFPSLPPLAAGLALASLLALLAIAALTPVPADDAPARLAPLALPALAALAIAVGAFVTREHPWLAPAPDHAWLETQRWARAHSAPATLFVTPPYRAGWRVESRRPTFGELRDGGLLFYAGAPALAWADRMRALGMHSYAAAWTDDPPPDRLEPERRAYAEALRAHAADWADAGVSYIVCEPDPAIGDLAVGRRVWTNGSYEIRELADLTTLGSDDARP